MLQGPNSTGKTKYESRLKRKQWLQDIVKSKELQDAREFHERWRERKHFLDEQRYVAAGFWRNAFGSDYTDLSPAKADTLAVTLGVVNASIYTTLLVTPPPLNFLLFGLLKAIFSSLTGMDKDDHKPKSRHIMTADEMKKQQKREKDPIPHIMDRFRLGEGFKYHLLKNRLEALTKLDPQNPQIKELEGKLQSFEANNLKNSKMIPYIATKIGTAPFEDEALRILRDLGSAKRRELLSTLDSSTLTPAMQTKLTQLISAKNNGEFINIFRTLTPEEQNLILGSCDVEKYEELVREKMIEDLEQKLKDPNYKNSVECMALNRYIHHFTFHGVRGVMVEDALKQELSEKGGEMTIGSFRENIMSDEYAMHNVWGNVGECNTYSGGPEGSGIDVNFSSASGSSVKSLLHEANHAHYQVGGQAFYNTKSFLSQFFRGSLPEAPISGQKQLIYDINEIEKRMGDEIGYRLKNNANFPNIKDLNSYKDMKDFVKDLGLNLTPEEAEKLVKMTSDPNFSPTTHRGRSEQNRIINEQNPLIRVYIALRYFKDMQDGPNFANNMNKLNSFFQDPANQELVEIYKHCFTEVALSSSYNYKNEKSKAIEVIARVEAHKNELDRINSLKNSESYARLKECINSLRNELYQTAIPSELRDDLTLGSHSHSHNQKKLGDTLLKSGNPIQSVSTSFLQNNQTVKSLFVNNAPTPPFKSLLSLDSISNPVNQMRAETSR